LAGTRQRGRKEGFFETDGLVVHPQHRQASGNPVRIGDGCATVTGYRLPKPLVPRGTGKAGARFQARSQDIGLTVLVVVSIAGPAGRRFFFGTNFSVKEKDEASPSRECGTGFAGCLHSPIWRGLKAFRFRAPRWSLKH
jgi:hypothetical protein